jgi:thioredoxin 1
MIASSQEKTVPHSTRKYPALLLLAGAALCITLTGCGRAEDQTTALAPAAEPQAQGATVPAPVIPADAPVMSAVFPALSSGILQGARLTDLPEGIILHAEGVAITQADLDREIEQAPQDMRASLQQNAFFLLEEQASEAILEAHVRKQTPAGSSSSAMLQMFFAKMLEDLAVNEGEITAFYEANQDMLGDTPLEQARPSIEQHLVQLQQQEVIENFIRDLGKTEPIALDKEWVTAQAALAMDNDIDKARHSGTPAFVSFGADTCIPCKQMAPFREDIAQKYGDRLNVVYVHVNKDPFLASRYGVRGIPHIIFFDADGKESFTHTGFMPQEQLEAEIQNLGVTL